MDKESGKTHIIVLRKIISQNSKPLFIPFDVQQSLQLLILSNQSHGSLIIDDQCHLLLLKQ